MKSVRTGAREAQPCVLRAALGSSSSRISLGTRGAGAAAGDPLFPALAEDFHSSLEASFGGCGKSLGSNKSLLVKGKERSFVLQTPCTWNNPCPEQEEFLG